MPMINHCVSYPKSGRTWLRRMLEVAGCTSVLSFHHDDFEFNDGSCPSHDYSIEPRLARYGASVKVIYLDRDPRDVMVSLYHQVTGRFQDIFGYTGDVSAFIRDDYFGAQVLARFRDVWGRILSQRNFLHISYEDLHADPAAVLRKVLSYLELSVDDDRLATAIDAGRFDNMRRLEQSCQHPEPWLRLRHGHPKVRHGKVGVFREELSAADISYLDRAFGFAGRPLTGQGSER